MFAAAGVCAVPDDGRLRESPHHRTFPGGAGRAETPQGRSCRSLRIGSSALTRRTGGLAAALIWRNTTSAAQPSKERIAIAMVDMERGVPAWTTAVIGLV